MQQAIIQILDDIAKESMETFRETNAKDIYPTWISTAKSRIQSLQPKVPTITIPEGTVLLGKDEYESLKEKAWRYDDLNK